MGHGKLSFLRDPTLLGTAHRRRTTRHAKRLPSGFVQIGFNQPLAGRCGGAQHSGEQKSGEGPRTPRATRSDPGVILSSASWRTIFTNNGCTPTVAARVIRKPSSSQSPRAAVSRSIILLSIGSGPVKGFAVTLAVGICTSMFTAIMGTRALVNLMYGGRTLERLTI